MRILAALSTLVLVASAAHAQTLTVYDDALQNGFADYSYGSGTNFSNAAFAHTGATSVSILGHSYNALSFAHVPGGIAASLHTADTPILRFWVNGGTAAGQRFHIALQNNGGFVGSAAPLDTYIAGGGIGLGVWREVTIDLRQAPFSAVDFDRIDIQSDEDATHTDASATYFDDMVLGQPDAAPVSALQIDHDVMVASMTSDRFTWHDSNGLPRVASLAHNDTAPVSGSYGGALREYSFQLSNGQTRTATVTTYGNAAYGGFGYVTLHSSHFVGCNGDDSPLGLQFAGTWQRVFEGRHHAIFRFKQSYPRNCPTSGPVVTRYLPVTIDWMFSTGHDNPLWAVTYDVDLIAEPGQPPVAAGTYFDDSRAPYGELNIDGDGWTNLNGVAWGDRYRFTTTNAAGTAVTLGSPFNWTATNTVPFVTVWLDGPLNAGRLDATMGIVQTQTIAQQDAGGARDLGVGSDITPYWHNTEAAGVHSAGAHAIPDGNNWPYQAAGNSLDWEYPNGSNNARLTWKTQFGFIGQATYLINNGAVESSAATAPGYPKKSYSTYVVLGQHSTVPEPVDAQRTQVETVQSLALTTAGGVGSVVTSGPAGITQTANVTYVPAGYNHVYGALAFRASSNQLDANVAVGAGTLSKPLLIISNYTAGFPQTIKLGGVALAADVDYFASLRPAASELWITLNRHLTGAANHIEITTGAFAAPQGLVASATSTSQVAVSWLPVAGATGYDVWRSHNNAPFALLASTVVAGYTDSGGGSGPTANATYVYKVLATGAGGPSAFSSIDAATTTIFTDDPLTVGTVVRAAHLTQLRTAVNAMRAAAGLGSFAFTDAALAAGTSIGGVHVSELRLALDQARAAIGLPALVYVDGIVVPGVTPVKAVHIVNLRDGVK